MLSHLTVLVLLSAGPNVTPVDHLDSVVMMPLSGFGSTEAALAATENILLREVSSILQQSLVSPEQWQSGDRSLKRALDQCDGAIGCLIEVFSALGHDGLIVGTMSGIGQERAITLKLYDLRRGKEVRQSSEKASGQKEELIRQMRKAAVQLLAPERFSGTLLVNARQPGVQILIDGELAATTPLDDPRIPLSVGTHSIEARGDRLVPFEAMIDIAYEEVKELEIDLPRGNLFVGGRRPYYTRWWTWTLGGLGVAALGGSLGLYRLHNNLYAEYEANPRLSSVELENLRNQARNQALYPAWGLAAGGGALVVTAAALLLSDLKKNRKGKDKKKRRKNAASDESATSAPEAPAPDQADAAPAPQ